MNFEDAFSEENEKEINVGPKAWQKYINSMAPDGFYYEYMGNGGYQLVSEKQNLKFKFNVKIPEDLKNINLKSGKDLQKLIYRSQRKFEVEVKDIIAGERSIDIEELVKTFSNNVQHEHDKVYLLPNPLRPPIRIPVEFNGETYYFSFKQMAYPSLTKVIFESDENNVIHIKLVIDEETEKMNISLTYNFLKANSLQGIYENKDVISNFSIGNIKIFGQYIEFPDKEEQKAIQENLSFYIKLYEIEKEFNVNFNLKYPISTIDIINLEKIYCSFIEGQYYYFSGEIGSCELTATKETDVNSVENNETGMTILGHNSVNITILEQSFNFFEQFIFKEAYYNNERGDKIEEGSKLSFQVASDKIAYKKLFNEIPKRIDFDEILTELGTAKLIN